MNSRSALATAAGVALTVAGGVSALFLTVGQTGPAGDNTELSTVGQQIVSVEYVDQFGNPVAPPASGAPVGVAANPEVVFVDSAGNPLETLTEALPMSEPVGSESPESYAPEQHEEEDDDHEEDEYEDGDDYEAMGSANGAEGNHG